MIPSYRLENAQTQTSIEQISFLLRSIPAVRAKVKSFPKVHGAPTVYGQISVMEPILSIAT
jgi:hypothetical protein